MTLIYKPYKHQFEIRIERMFVANDMR